MRVDDIVVVNNIKHAWQFLFDSIEYPMADAGADGVGRNSATGCAGGSAEHAVRVRAVPLNGRHGSVGSAISADVR